LENTVGALSHLRVLDLSRVLAGPWASQTLADLGADVIKIERPDTGDDTRAWGPPWIGTNKSDDDRLSAYFAGANRNKKSIALNIADPRGAEIVKSLAANSDVFIENFKVGGLKQYGLDYETLKELNPRLIYCSITGFGQSGPYAQRPGYDFLIQGMGGLMSITGRPDGEAGEGPLKVGVALTDILTGLYATVGILAALSHREKTGEGQYIDASLLDVQVACLANQAMNFLASGQQPPRLGNGHPNIVPYQDFRTSDGYMILTVGNEGQFSRLCEVLGHGEWAKDPRFATNTARLEHRAVLIPLIQAALAEGKTTYWLDRLESANVPCGPINDLEGVFSDPHVKSRMMRVDIPSDHGDTVSVVANPLRLSASPVQYKSAPPRLGEQTQQILRDVLGMSDERIDALVRESVVRV
jgi:crotonobetainyl-CoA:carnitine CoA-transferase CaiB-like acyl-CoA transferase